MGRLSILLRRNSGATVIEYALVAASISILMAGTAGIIGGELQAIFLAVADAV